MAEDILPELLKKITEAFQDEFEKEPRIKELYKIYRSGKATYKEAEDFAYIYGKILTSVEEKFLSSATLPDGKMYFNIAERLLRPLLEDNYDTVAEYATGVQTSLNKAANIGMKAQAAPINNDRIDELIDIASNADHFDDVASKLFDSQVNYSQSVVDDTLKKNFEFQSRSGLRPKLIRIAESGCCKWCSSLEGTYEYPNVSKDVYRRHKNCRCIVDYDPGTGKRQDVWSKKIYTNTADEAIDRKKKVLNLKDSLTRDESQWTDEKLNDKINFKERFANGLANNPSLLGTYTPASLKEALKSSGFEVKPLGDGSFKNVPFENGGGYRVHFSDGGVIMYHPEERSHHEGEYYKISTGKGGTHRYDRNGKEKSTR